MAFNFGSRKTAKKSQKPASSEPVSKEEAEYRERAKNDVDRYKLAVDTEFWCALCFASEEERDRARRFLGADDDGFAFGDRVREVLAQRVDTGLRRMISPKRVSGRRVKNPLASVEYTGDPERDCFAEADAILAALLDADGAGFVGKIYDSPWYVPVIFRDRGQLDSFLRDFGLLKYGDVYLDGSRLFADLGL